MKPLRLILKIVIFLAVCVSAVPVLAKVNISDIETAIIEEDYPRSRSLAEEYLALNPQGRQLYEAQYYLALSALRVGDAAWAGEIFSDLTKELKPGDLYDRATLGIIDALYFQQKYDLALAKAEHLFAARKDSQFRSLTLLKIARANLKLARWDEAREALQTIVHVYAQSAEYHIAKQLLEEKQYFTVQVGAFLNQHHAENLAEELKTSGQYAFIVETADRNHNVFYRVRIGRFSSLDQAFDLKNKISKKGYPTRIYP